MRSAKKEYAKLVQQEKDLRAKLESAQRCVLSRHAQIYRMIRQNDRIGVCTQSFALEIPHTDLHTYRMFLYLYMYSCVSEMQKIARRREFFARVYALRAQTEIIYACIY